MATIGDIVIVNTVEFDQKGKPVTEPTYLAAIVTAVSEKEGMEPTANLTVFNSGGGTANYSGVRVFGSAADLSKWREDHPEDHALAAFEGEIPAKEKQPAA